jgi:hypothetical protein
MKVIAFILSAYLIVLLAVPCCSFDNCPEENIPIQTEHEEQNKDCGSCSPFFTCTSCSGFTVSALINSELISFISHNQYPSFNVSIVPDMNYDFWQPPKLG